MPLPDKSKVKYPVKKWHPPKIVDVPAFKFLDLVPFERRYCVVEGEHEGRLEAHHIIPRHLGGTDDPENLRVLCLRHHAAEDPYRAQFLADELENVDIAEHFFASAGLGQVGEGEHY